MSSDVRVLVNRDDIEVISCRFDLLRQLAQRVVDGDEGDAVAIGQAIHDLAELYSAEAERLLHSQGEVTNA
jgi:hypothetical protein